MFHVLKIVTAGLSPKIIMVDFEKTAMIVIN